MTTTVTRPAAPTMWDPDADEIAHEALVSIRLAPTAAGQQLLEHLRSQPGVVNAWWIAADIDAMVLLRCPSMPLLHQAITDLRLRGGAETTDVHSILRPINLRAVGSC
ncbi:hypothetical protein ACQP2F_32640 [Actinoplanes sp. CA-030573]|uniref:hypothetical protein n=1 Tax=Actinoplanes sp. CA-030573 TaxID=3239898 RepID=UPI003D9006FE